MSKNPNYFEPMSDKNKKYAGLAGTLSISMFIGGLSGFFVAGPMGILAGILLGIGVVLGFHYLFSGSLLGLGGVAGGVVGFFLGDYLAAGLCSLFGLTSGGLVTSSSIALSLVTISGYGLAVAAGVLAGVAVVSGIRLVAKCISKAVQKAEEPRTSEGSAASSVQQTGYVVGVPVAKPAAQMPPPYSAPPSEGVQAGFPVKY